MNQNRRVLINNVSHSLSISYEDLNNPLLLCIHGGPAQAESAYISSYQKELEKHFIIVRHDQRGAGLTGWKNVKENTLTIKEFVQDTLKVTEYLLKQYNKQKVFIMGHSWGSILASLSVKEKPNFYYAYIGVSQVVDYIQAMDIGLQTMKKSALINNDTQLLKLLEKCGTPPYSKKEFATYQKCIKKMNGFIYTPLEFKINKSIFNNISYSFIDKLLYFYNAFKSIKIFYTNGIEFNLFDEIVQIDIPVFFISGKHDLSTPPSLVQQYYNNLISSKKEMYILNYAAHMPQLEEYKKFNQLLIHIKEKETYGKFN